jgi:hypothetical protein
MVRTMTARPGTAYSAEALAPFVTEWLTIHGVAVKGGYVKPIALRNIVRAPVGSPIPRVAAEPPDGSNRDHSYTIDEAADLLTFVARKYGLVNMDDTLSVPLPAPFAGHGAATIVPPAPVKAPRKPRAATAPVARVKAPAIVATVKPVDAS